MNRLKAIILDRDGVINFDSPDYILSPEQWQPIPGSLQAIAHLHQAGLPVALASNQSALARKMITQSEFEAIHAKMLLEIESAGGFLDHVAYCPHGPDDACECRKPEPGLVQECLDAIGMADQPEQVVMIGDSLRDVQAALAVGVRPILVQSGYGDAAKIAQKAHALDPDIPVYADLGSAVDALLSI